MMSDDKLQSIAKVIEPHTGTYTRSNGMPCFILTADDPSAASFVDQWADFNSYKLGREHPDILRARSIAKSMREWKA